MVSAALLAFLLLAPAPSDRPVLAVAGDRVLVALPPSILKQKEVHARLESALTTTFVVKTRDANARIEIRYDLWDDVYRVKRIDAAGRMAQQSVTAAQLEAWWRTPIDIARRGGGATIDVELVVLPAANRARVQPTSFDQADRLINEALIAARAQLARHNGGRHLRLVS